MTKATKTIRAGPIRIASLEPAAPSRAAGASAGGWPADGRLARWGQRRNAAPVGDRRPGHVFGDLRRIARGSHQLPCLRTSRPRRSRRRRCPGRRPGRRTCRPPRRSARCRCSGRSRVSSHTETYGASLYAFRTSCRCGLGDASLRLRARREGSRTPWRTPPDSAFSTVKLRKSTHSVGRVHPAGVAVDAAHHGAGLAVAAGTRGRGTRARSGSGFSSGVSDAITPGSQAPMSSIAAWWLATRPADDAGTLLCGGRQEAVVERLGRQERLAGSRRLRASTGR